MSEEVILTPSQIEFAAGKVLLIDKPLKWTSFDAVNYIRKIVSPKKKKIKVGHAGTLDPLASGLLIICTGPKTKTIDSFRDLDKVYTGTITVGNTTPSFDLETEISDSFPIAHISKELILEKALSFTGVLQQTPPVYSAKKQDGERLYEKARRGEEVIVRVIEIEVKEFKIIDVQFNESTINIDFEINCSKGTYIRSIANDFGKALESGAHLSALRRTKIGEFDVINSQSIEQFRELYSERIER